MQVNLDYFNYAFDNLAHIKREQKRYNLHWVN